MQCLITIVAGGRLSMINLLESQWWSYTHLRDFQTERMLVDALEKTRSGKLKFVINEVTQ